MVAVALLVALALLAAGCGSSGSSAPSTRTTRTTESAPGPHDTVAFQRVSGLPFGVAATTDGRYAFVDLVGGKVLVYALGQGAPRLVRAIQVPGEAVGSSLTRDGRLLLVADGSGAAVISVARAESGAKHPLLGMLFPPVGSRIAADGAIETASSADGRYVFVSLEYGNPDGLVSVYDIGSTVRPRVRYGDYVGAIRLGEAVVGSALSPNGRYLYVTSELARNSRRMSADGTLSVIDVATAERDPARSVVATVPAMNQPVRVAVSPDGSTVWVTARGSNRLLAFSASRLLSDPGRALVAQVKVGTAPVGVAVFDHGGGVLVADSDRFNARGAHANLTIVNAKDALAHRPAVVGTLRAGRFPREIAVEPSGQVALVSNFASGQLETVHLQ